MVAAVVVVVVAVVVVVMVVVAMVVATTDCVVVVEGVGTVSVGHGAVLQDLLLAALLPSQLMSETSSAPI